MEFIGLKNSSDVRLVGGAARNRLIVVASFAEGFQKGIREVLAVKRLLREVVIACSISTAFNCCPSQMRRFPSSAPVPLDCRPSVLRARATRHPVQLRPKIDHTGLRRTLTPLGDCEAFTSVSGIRVRKM